MKVIPKKLRWVGLLVEDLIKDNQGGHCTKVYPKVYPLGLPSVAHPNSIK